MTGGAMFDIGGGHSFDRSRLTGDEYSAMLKHSNSVLAGTLFVLMATLGTYELPELRQRILSSLRRVIGADVSMFFVSENQDRLRLLSADGETIAPVGVYSVRIGEGFAGTVAKERKPLWIEDVTRESFLSDVLIQGNIRSAFGIPLIADGKVYGVLEVLWRKMRPLSDEESAMLTVVAGLVKDVMLGAEEVQVERRMEELSAAHNRVVAMLTLARDAREEIPQALPIVAEAARCRIAAIEERRLGYRPYFASFGQISSHIPKPPLLRPTDVMCESKCPEYFDAHSALGEWARWNFGIAHGMVMSLGDGEGRCWLVIAGRSIEKPPLEYRETRFLRQVHSTVSAAIRNSAKRTADHDVSKTLQRALRSRARPVEGFGIESVYRSATRDATVGGDFFDLWEFADGQIGVLLGDISGHGVKAAVMTMLIKSVVSAYLFEGERSPAKIVTRLNPLLIETMGGNDFASLILLVFDPASDTCRYCCAGHPPAYLGRHGGGVEVLTGRSPIVGVLDQVTFTESSFPLGRDDILFLYTDGATEARDGASEFFGEDRLLRTFEREVVKGFDGLVGRVYDSVERFAGGEFRDDIAMLGIHYEQ